jgi:prefoldin subunit 5
LDQFESQANALEAQITRDKELLDRTNQSQIDSYNQKIDRYNRTSEQLKSHIDSFNSGVNAFNAELKRVGTPTN